MVSKQLTDICFLLINVMILDYEFWSEIVYAINLNMYQSQEDNIEQ